MKAQSRKRKANDRLQALCTLIASLGDPLELPCRVVRVIDGDTVVVAVSDSGREYPVRLLDCWAPELSEPGGREAKAAAERIIRAAKKTFLSMPWPDDSAHPLAVLSLGRILAHVFVGPGRTLSELMVRHGHAFATKEGLAQSRTRDARRDQRSSKPKAPSPSP